MVTSFTMRTFAAPTITRAYLAWPFSAARQVVPHWLRHRPERRPPALGDPQAARRRRPTRAARRSSCRRPGPARRRRWTRALRPFLSPGADADHRLAAAPPATSTRCSPTPAAPRSRSASATPGRAARCRARRSRRPPTSSPSPDVDMTTLLDHVRTRPGQRAEGGRHLDRRPGRRGRRHRRRPTPPSATAARWPPCSTPRRTPPARPRRATGYVRGFRSRDDADLGHRAPTSTTPTRRSRDYQADYFGPNAAPPRRRRARRTTRTTSSPSRRTTERRSAVLRVLVVEAAAGVPLRALVAVRRHAARVLEHPGQVHQVPGHEGRCCGW